MQSDDPNLRETWEIARRTLDAFDANPGFYAAYVDEVRSMMLHARKAREARRVAEEAAGLEPGGRESSGRPTPVSPVAGEP
jgi:hypothetical protein